VIKYRYDILNKRGEQEPWSGVFDTLEDALKWFAAFGDFHINRGHELIKVEVRDTDMGGPELTTET